jgi:outer membrane protein TolC
MKTQLPLALLLLVCSTVSAAPADRGPEPQTSPVTAPPALERLLAGRPVVNQALTVDQAVAIALRESPVVRGAVEEVEAAVGRLEAARAEQRPWVSANTFVSGGNNMNIVAGPPVSQPQMIMGLPDGLFFDGNVMAMYPLYTSGRLKALVRQAAALRDATRADLETQRQEVALMTRAAYREVLARRALIEVWRTRLREDEERLRVDRLKLREGQIPILNVLRDEAEVAATRQELTNAERDLDLSLLQLQTVMGVSPASRIEVPGTLEYQPSADLIARLSALVPQSPTVQKAPDAQPSMLPADLAALLRLAERRRPELQAAGRRIRAALAETAAIRGAYGPQVNLFGMGDVLSEDPHLGVTVGAVASLPLYNGGQRRARLRTVEAERRVQEQEQQRIALQVAQEVTSALLNLRAAEQNIRTAQAALASAREDYRVQLLRYEAGRSVLVEVLDAQAALVRAESNVVQALFQYNLARDRLLRAVGASTSSLTTG